MRLSETQRFIYGLLTLTFVTILVLVIINVFAVDVFVLLLIVEFLLLVEITKPAFLKATWRKNVAIVIIACIIVFLVVLYQRARVI